MNSNAGFFFTTPKRIFLPIFAACLSLLFCRASLAQPVYQWAKSIGSYLGFHQATGMCFDIQGNVYITGFCGADVDFDPGPGITPLPGAVETNTYIAKYDPSGNFIWVKTIPSEDNETSSIAVDAQGNVYVTSIFYVPSIDFQLQSGIKTIYSNGGYSNFFIAKYDSSGNCLWANGFGGEKENKSRSIALDKFGNVYVTGFFSDTVNFDPDNGNKNLISKGSDFFIAKYDSDGKYLWAKSASGADDQGNQVVIDDAGNAYVAGSFTSNISFSDLEGGHITAVDTEFSNIFFAKYDANGNFKWVKSAGIFISFGNGVKNNIVIDSSGFLYIDGWYKNTTDFDPGNGTAFLPGFGSFFAKYDNDGNYIWTKSIGSIATELDIGLKPSEFALAVDKMSNIYITGEYRDTNNFAVSSKNAKLKSKGVTDIFLAKYDSDGNYLWVEGIGSDSANASNISRAIAVDNSENIFIAGNFFGTTDFDSGPNIVDLPPKGWFDKGADIFFAEYSQVKSSVQSSEEKKTDVAIFPNPTTGLINLQGTLPTQAKLEAKVFNILGAEVLPQTFDVPSEFSLQMDVSKLPAGMYTIELTSAGFRKQAQFVKE